MAAKAQAVMIYRLIFLTGSHQGQRITIEKSPMTLGRAPDCTVVLQDEEAALRHAALEHREQGLHIRDLGTMNRILVNGREVHEGWLKHGDEVEIGRTCFLVQAVFQADVHVVHNWTEIRRRRLRRAGAAAALALAVLAVVLSWQRSRPRAAPEAAGADAERDVVAALPADASEAPPPAAGASGVVAAAETSGTGSVDLLPVAAELRTLREDLVDIRQTVKELASRQLSTSGPAGSAAAPAAPAAGEQPRETVGVPVPRAEAVLADARRLLASDRLAEADGMLAELQRTAPDFLPAYEERAALFERRSMPEKAMEQWLEILDRNPPETLQAKATSEYLRLEGAGAAPPLPRGHIRIAGVEHQRFPESDEFAEMRVLSIRLQADPAGGGIDPRAVRVDVTFFDKDPQTGLIAPSRAPAPGVPLRPQPQWDGREPATVTASYVVRTHERDRDVRAGRLARYYGYSVRVFYGDALQDQAARPLSLLYRKAAPADAGGAALVNATARRAAAEARQP